MSGHTPGPWRWWTSCSFNRLSSDATGKDGDVLRAVKYRDGVAGIEGSEADMRLIAAAPDLLEALRVAYRHIDPNGLRRSHGKDIALIDAALAKATGESA